MRIVVDTNILASAVCFPQSRPAEALRLMLRYATPLVSVELAREYEAVLKRPKFDEFTSPAAREIALSKFLAAAEEVEVHSIVDACRDSKDNMVLALCLDGDADLLVTGDKDLQVLHQFEETRIVSAADVVAVFPAGDGS